MVSTLLSIERSTSFSSTPGSSAKMQTSFSFSVVSSLGQLVEASPAAICGISKPRIRSEEHTSELQSLMRISYAVFCLKKKNNNHIIQTNLHQIYYYKTNS